jgi:beta-glucanase (GH16 family)
MLSRHLLAAAACIGFAAAQTTTSCQPLNTTGCPADPALGTSHLWNFNMTPNGNLWTNYGGPVDYDAENGATFTISQEGDSPTIRTAFYFFFGRTEVVLKAAPGQGIVSSMMWLSDDLDEVDWEFLGTNTTFAFSNYFGKGRQIYTNGGDHPVSSPQDDFHNYTTIWTKESLEWWIDGNLVRTLLPSQANDTNNYPQTPMRMSLGIWAGGSPNEPEGVIEWAGGKTDFSKGPYNMYVKSVYVEDATSGKDYTYGDHSGTWQSIKVADGNSTALETITTPDSSGSESISQKWNNMSSGAHIAVYAGAGAGAALLFGTMLFYCIRQRRIGARTAKMEAEKAEADRLEMERFKRDGIDPDSLNNEAVDYNAKDMKGSTYESDTYSVPPSPRGPPVGYAAAGGVAGMRAQSQRTASPAPSSPFGDPRTPYSPVPGGLGAPPPQHANQAPYRDASRSPAQQGSVYGRPSPALTSPFNDPPGSAHSGFGAPPRSPMSRTQSPAMPPPQGGLPPTPFDQMRSESPASAYGRRGSPGPQQGYGPPGRMRTPGPQGTQSPRSFSGNQGGYRQLSGGNDGWNQGGYRQ